MVEKQTGSQLRADIDSGQTGDKVPFPDPAAAPLETDAEAGGATTEFFSERRNVAHVSGRNWTGLIVYIGIVAVIALGVIALAANIA